MLPQTTKFGVTNPAKEVSPNKLNGTIAEQQKKVNYNLHFALIFWGISI